MRWMGVLMGSLVASAILVAAWAWRIGAGTDSAIPCSALPISDAADVAKESGAADETVSQVVAEAATADKGPVADSAAAVDKTSATSGSDAEIGPVPESAAPLPVGAEPERVPETQPEPEPGMHVVGDGSDEYPSNAEIGTTDHPIVPEGVVSAVQWHSFWRPFTSEVSARGFARRLEQLTGLDFQVKRAAAGRYEVAFAHLDDAQRQAHLDRIQTVTGLQLEATEDRP